MDIRARDITSISFTCNICDSPCEVELRQLRRDTPACPNCECPPRARAVVNMLSISLFGRSLTIPDFPSRPDLTGIGLSDPGRPRQTVIKGHVAPPVERAFESSFRLLKPGGILILTLPFFPTGETSEHFPNLNEYEIVDFAGSPILVNRTVDGRWEVFDDLRFHHGEGNPLEVRVFSRSSVLHQLEAAGFEEITEWTSSHAKFGIPSFEGGHSVPISARRPAR